MILYQIYTHLATIILYHPRCKDSHTTYFEGVSTPPDDVYTQEEIEQIIEDNKREQRQQYAKRQAEKYERLAEYSLDEENRKKYGARAKEWNEVVNGSKPLYFDETSDYSVNIKEYSDKVNKSLSEALEDVARKGSQDRCEHMYLVDLDTGEKLYYETNGEAASVGIDFWKYVEEHPNKK